MNTKERRKGGIGEMAFVGTYEHSLDGAGRLVLPSRLRSHFEDWAYLSPDAGCMAIRTPEHFDAMVARVQENRAKVVLAEAEVPRAMAEAFNSGRLGLVDYYELKNVQADTKMRDSIASVGSDGNSTSSS